MNMILVVERVGVEYKELQANSGTTLQNRQKWQRPRRSVKHDDIVLICDYDIQRNYWKLGRVIELLPSQDDRSPEE